MIVVVIVVVIVIVRVAVGFQEPPIPGTGKTATHPSSAAFPGSQHLQRL